MAKTTVITGLILILLGVVGYMGSDPAPSNDDASAVADANSDAQDTEAEMKEKPKGKSVTALIPSFVGAVLAICGLIAFNESARKHAMHAAVMVGLLGFLAGAGRGAMGIGKFLSNDPSLNQRSFLFVWLMAIICAVFVFLCVQSFINARKQMQKEAAEAK